MNLPLFHRRWAGIAKVKIKVVAGAIHGFFWLLIKSDGNSAANEEILQAKANGMSRANKTSGSWMGIGDMKADLGSVRYAHDKPAEMS